MQCRQGHCVLTFAHDNACAQHHLPVLLLFDNPLAPPPKKLHMSGGDSGIGRAVAVHFAREGADVAIVYLDEHKDAEETVALVEKEGRKALKFAGDVGKPEVRL